MKRKVKFQEGVAVEEPSPRSRKLRQTAEKMHREGGRLRAAERARERQVAERETSRRAAAERARSQREVAQFNARPEVAARNQMTDTRIPAPPRPSSVTPVENMPPRRIPEPPRPSTIGTMRGAAGPAMRAGSRLIPGVGALAGMAPTSMEAGAEFEREGLRRVREEAARNQDLDNLRRALPEGPDIEAERAARGAPPRPRPAARPAPAGSAPRSRAAFTPARRELSMEEIRALRSGARAPRTSEERALREGLRDLSQPRQRMSEADMLKERELQRIRAERMAEEQMGGSGNIGAASARERGEQVGPTGDYNMKKGGMVPSPKAVVKKKAGGMIAAKSKKGGAVAKPKGKAMPFKKGGAVKGKK